MSGGCVPERTRTLKYSLSPTPDEAVSGFIGFALLEQLIRGAEGGVACANDVSASLPHEFWVVVAWVASFLAATFAVRRRGKVSF